MEDAIVEMLQLLDTMTPIEFLAFRDFLGSGSDFQSLQFRIIEMKLGLTDNSRQSYKTKYFTDVMFKGEQSRELKKTVNEKSLLILVEVSFIINCYFFLSILIVALAGACL